VEFNYGIPQIVKYVLSITVICIIIYFLIKLPTKDILESNFRFIFIWFIFYSIILLVTSLFRFNALIYFQRVFADRTFFLPYLIPILLMFIKFDVKFFHIIFNYTSILIFPVAFILIVILLFARSQEKWLEQFELINLFNIGSYFLLLTAHYSRKRHVSLIVISYYLIYIILALIYGRRGVVISSLLLLSFMILIRLRSPFSTIKQRIKMYLIGMVLSLLIISFGYLLQSTYAFERGFSKEGFNQSRSVVFNDFFEDFRSTSDWVFGRGIEGRVYRSIKSEGSLDIIEQGYLTIILRGGLLYLIPFILVLLRSIYLGLFKSQNDLTKALAILVFIHLVLMFYFNLPDYSSYYLFIWISALACYNPNIRNFSDVELARIFNKPLKFN